MGSHRGSERFGIVGSVVDMPALLRVVNKNLRGKVCHRRNFFGWTFRVPHPVSTIVDI